MILFINNINNKIIEFKKKEKEEKVKNNYIKGAAKIGAGGYLGQQALRSGIPRALGVRLESHSTSKENARKILKDSDGYLNPNLGGTGVTKDLVNTDKPKRRIYRAQDDPKAFVNRAKNNVYVTGRLPGYKGDGNNVGNISKSIYNNPVGEQFYKKMQRWMYRGQASLPFDNEKIKEELNKWEKDTNYKNNRDNAKQKIKEITESLKKESKTPLNKKRKALEKELSKQQNIIRSTGKGRVSERNKIKEKMIEQRKPQAVRTGIFKGRSLYTGGSDDYFKENFKADPDDMLAMKTNKPIKVYGNRFSATMGAIKREGLTNLIKKNPKRVAAGLSILGAGGLMTKGLIQSGIKDMKGDVKEHNRKLKSGKIVKVKSYKKK